MARWWPDLYGVKYYLGDLIDGLFSPDEESQISSSDLGLGVQTELVERLLDSLQRPASMLRASRRPLTTS